jgi:hypothetical protein
VTGVLPSGSVGLGLEIFFRDGKEGLKVLKFSFVQAEKGVFWSWNLPKNRGLETSKQVL